MSCSPFDLRDYCLDELSATQRREVESHLHGCVSCREEIERLQCTRQALLRLKDEEIPRRIAFVSDKVFEPWWRARWCGAVAKFCLAPALLLIAFFAGAWTSQARMDKSLAAMESQHAAQMQDVKQTYEMLVIQMNEFYRQQAEVRPASFRQ